MSCKHIGISVKGKIRCYKTKQKPETWKKRYEKLSESQKQKVIERKLMLQKLGRKKNVGKKTKGCPKPRRIPCTESKGWPYERKNKHAVRCCYKKKLKTSPKNVRKKTKGCPKPRRIPCTEAKGWPYERKNKHAVKCCYKRKPKSVQKKKVPEKRLIKLLKELDKKAPSRSQSKSSPNIYDEEEKDEILLYRTPKSGSLIR